MIGLYLGFQTLGLMFRFWITNTWEYFPDEDAAAIGEEGNYFFKKNADLCFVIASCFLIITVFDYFQFVYHPLQKNVLINVNN